MAPRGRALPQATTESAKEARKAFFCELCQKGYARMNEFEAHEGSYDHQHRKRLKEMKQLSKDSSAIAKARAADERENADLKSISLPRNNKLNPTGPKKKPVFISTAQQSQSHSSGFVPTGFKPASVKISESGGAANYSERDRPFDAGTGTGAFEFDTSIDWNDLDRAKMNGWSEKRYDPLVYHEFEHAVFLQGRKGQRCGNECRFCEAEKPMEVLGSGDLWNEEKQEELLRLLRESGQI